MELTKLYSLAERQNITVDCFRLAGGPSLSMAVGQSYYVAIDPFQLATTADERVKLAHELGHCMTGSFYNTYSRLDVIQKHEHQANVWAIKKLTPKDEFYRACEKGYTEIWELAEYFTVTEDFMRKAVEYYKNIE